VEGNKLELEEGAGAVDDDGAGIADDDGSGATVEAAVEDDG
jgi:hypothetical protein